HRRAESPRPVGDTGADICSTKIKAKARDLDRQQRQGTIVVATLATDPKDGGGKLFAPRAWHLLSASGDTALFAGPGPASAEHDRSVWVCGRARARRAVAQGERRCRGAPDQVDGGRSETSGRAEQDHPWLGARRAYRCRAGE